MDLIYPVGSIYVNSNNVDPKVLFGGTWKKIEGRFLIGAGGKYELGAVGGSEDAIVVAHDNHIVSASNAIGTGTYKGYLNVDKMTPYHDLRGWLIERNDEVYPATITVGEDGIGKNMPPFLVVNIWKRIA